MTATTNDTLYVRSLEKGLAVLSLFETADRPLSLTEIAARTGYGMSAAQRFTHTLERLGYLAKDPRTRRYRPALKAFGLGQGYERLGAVPAAGATALGALSERLGESVRLCVLDGTDAVTVLCLPGQDPGSNGAGPEQRGNVANSAAGRAMLSYLPAMDAVSRVFSAPRDALTPKTLTDPQRIMAAVETARSMGYALIDGERETGEISIAAAVLDQAGLPVGAVEATAPRARWKWRKAREKMASAVAETAQSVTARLATLE